MSEILTLVLLALVFCVILYVVLRWLVSFLRPKSATKKTALRSRLKRLFTKEHSVESLADIIHEIGEGHLLNDHDKKLLQSVLTFRDRIVREVMVPRVDLFCLPDTCTIREAALAMQKE